MALPPESARCKAKKKSGEQCRAVAVENGLCHLHGHPGRAAELGRESGRARRSLDAPRKTQPEVEPPKTAQQVRDLLGQVMSDVRARRLAPKIASTMGYLASVLLKSIEVSDTEVRLAALESQINESAAQN